MNNNLQENIDLIAKQSFETATFIRRAMAFLLDLLMIVVIAYVFVIVLKVFKDIDKFFEFFEATQNEIEDIDLYNEMRNLFFKAIIKTYLIWLVAKLVYFTLIPAIIGNGRTLGKLVAGIGVVSLESLDELSPSRLILREFVGRIVIETILLVPYLISIIIAFYREDSRSLHDLIAKSVVIRLDMFEASTF